MTKRLLVPLACLFGVGLSFAACGGSEDSTDGEMMATTAGTSTTSAAAPGDTGATGAMGGGGAGSAGDATPDADCPATEPGSGGACEVPFSTNCEYPGVVCNCLGLSGDGMWLCTEADDAGDDGDGPATDDADDDDEPFGMGGDNPFGMGGGGNMLPDFEDCPADAPTEGDDCNVGFMDCDYGGMTCECEGNFGNRTWTCGGDDGPGGDDPPQLDGDGGVLPEPDPDEPDPQNPEQCPEAIPPDNVCDIGESVDFGTQCRYGNQTCTCGGFPDDGEWACEEGEDPMPDPEPEPGGDPDGGVPDPGGGEGGAPNASDAGAGE